MWTCIRRRPSTISIPEKSTGKECYMTVAEHTADRQEWMDKVDSVRETLIAFADEAEEQRTLPRPAADALRDVGFFKLKLPLELGGAQADQALVMEVIEGLSYIHPAAGWCVMTSAGGAAMIGSGLGDEGTAQVFSQGRPVAVAGSVFPAGTAIPEADGYRVNGRWRFASGIQHSDWISAGAVVVNNGNSEVDTGVAPIVIQVVVPTSAVQIHDNWRVAGLCGTGSCDFTIHDQFVSTELTYSQDLANPQPQRGGWRYRLPIIAFVADEHIGFALGVARRALDELTTRATTTRGQFRPSPLSERHVVHRFLGVYDVKLRAARALALALFDEIEQTLKAEQQVDKNLVTRSRALGVYVTE
ncbi:hypothetical protein GC175_29485, partial [bacterium]|nr:hypothetical protein [bacterium]